MQIENPGIKNRIHILNLCHHSLFCIERMAFADIELRDNGSNTFDIALSGGGAGPTGNSNFFLFFDHFPTFVMLLGGVSVFFG